MTIRRALQKIKGYCDKHEDCRSCVLSAHGETRCFMNWEVIPADWDIERLFRKSGGNEEEK